MRNTETGKEKMSFNRWLDEVHGITPEEWDENYSGAMADEIEAQYDEYWNE